LGAPGAHGSAIPVTYVPFRNAHFLSVAVSWAEAIGAGAIYIGAVAEDSSGYPDCRPEYYRVFQELIRVGTRPETQIEIVTPVITLKKSEIIRRGIELRAPLHLTWSCYQTKILPAAPAIAACCGYAPSWKPVRPIPSPIVEPYPPGAELGIGALERDNGAHIAWTLRAGLPVKKENGA